jgi:uncharacterized iron-regulated membrane protein
MLKKIIRKIHLWLAMISSIVILVVSITGCIYAFEKEIQDIYQEYRFVASQNKEFLSPSILKGIAEKQLPKKHLHSIKYNTKEKSVEAIFFQFEPNPYYYIVYLNPYSGEVLKTVDMDKTFFRFILNGHFYLWLPPDIGVPTVIVFMFIFLIMVISGIVLWWPKNKKSTAQRFTFNWKETTKWKRRNFDLHSIIGFYTSFFAIGFIVTGLVFSFPWFAELYYKKIGGHKSLTYLEPISKDKSETICTNNLDEIYRKIKSESPDAKSIEVHIPETDSSTISVNTNTENGTFWKTDYRYFNQYNLKEVKASHIYSRYKDATVADKILRMNFDIHVGAIGGLAGKTIAFLLSLLIASLPVTGFLMWWGRKK